MTAPPDKIAPTLDATLDARAVTHGDYQHVAKACHDIKAALRAAPRWNHTLPIHREALDMLAMKLARIVCGNCDDPDHWRDVAGYARLVERELTRKRVAPQ